MGVPPKGSKRYVERYDAEKDGDQSVAGDLAVTGNLTVSGVVVNLPNLPTSDPNVAGQLWSNAGVVTVSSG